MSIPTQDDAHLMVELFKLRFEPFLQESETWFAMQFQPEAWETIKARYPQGSKEWRMLTTVLGYWELLGALLDHNLLSEDLMFDAIESIDVTWDKVKEWIPHARLDMGSDLWENIELLVARQRRWRLVRVPKAELKPGV
jgi:hypothetical protein